MEIKKIEIKDDPVVSIELTKDEVECLATDLDRLRRSDEVRTANGDDLYRALRDAGFGPLD